MYIYNEHLSQLISCFLAHSLYSSLSMKLKLFFNYHESPCMFYWEGGWEVNSSTYQVGLEPFQKLGGLVVVVVVVVVVGGWWLWSKGILEFHFGQKLGLSIEVRKKLLHNSILSNTKDAGLHFYQLLWQVLAPQPNWSFKSGSKCCSLNSLGLQP